MAGGQAVPSRWERKMGTSQTPSLALRLPSKGAAALNDPGGANPPLRDLTQLHAAGCSLTFLTARREIELDKGK